MKGLLVFIFLLPLSVFSQDTTRYYQKSAFMYSDCYTFYRENSGDKRGSFIHEVSTDDVQIWYGEGSYVEYKKSYELSYRKLYDTLIVECFIDSSKVSDSVAFINKNIAKMWYMLIYHYSTSTDSPLVHFNDVYLWFDSSFSEPKNRFLNNVFWFNNNSTKHFFLPKTDRQIIVNIAYNPPNRLHFITPKKQEVLKKTKKGFKVKALFSNKRKELFVKKHY